jgi:tetratricopeptide (TPR) repeat protein
MLGILFGYSSDWSRAIELTERGMLLQPDHPGWYLFAAFFNEYLQADYTSALEIALRINMPEYYAEPMARAVVYAKLGDIEAAEAAVEEMLALRPNFESTYVSTDVDRWFYNAPQLVSELLDGLEKAGLDMQGNTPQQGT